jgi:hypothetical protein
MGPDPREYEADQRQATDDALRMEETRKYILEDWKLKADQRLRTFNFFLLVYGVITAGLLTFIKDSKYPWIAAPGGLWLAVISYVFWRIDCRSRMMLVNSEEIFRKLEERLPSDYRVFSRDKSQCDSAKSVRPVSGWIFPVTLYESFRLLFLAFALGGICLAVAAVLIPSPSASQSQAPIQQHFIIGGQPLPQSDKR